MREQKGTSGRSLRGQQKQLLRCQEGLLCSQEQINDFNSNESSGKITLRKKSLGLWLTLTKKHGSLIRAFNGNEIHKAYEHYPSKDIISNSRHLQYFYHSHRDTGEHGHIHVFSKSQNTSTTNHLLAIGLSEKGLPISLFTVEAASVNEKPIDSTTLERLLGQAVRKTQKETLLTDWLIAFCNFYKNDIKRLFKGKNVQSNNTHNENDIRELKLLNWEKDLELSEKHAIHYLLQKG